MKRKDQEFAFSSIIVRLSPEMGNYSSMSEKKLFIKVSFRVFREEWRTSRKFDRSENGSFSSVY